MDFDKKRLIMYGAGEQAKYALEYIENSDKESVPICFCDNSIEKQGKLFLGYDVHSLEDAKKMYPNSMYYVTTAEPLKYQIFKFLIDNGINENQIYNYDSGAKYYKSCGDLERFNLIVANNQFHYCCGRGNLNNEPPRIDFTNLENSINEFVEYRKNLMEDNTLQSISNECTGCPDLKYGYWKTSDKISTISFSPSYYCNLECNYCGVWQVHYNLENDEKKFLKTFDFSECIKLLEEKRLIDENTHIEISSGEITLNPFRDKILTAVKDYSCAVFSNAVYYNKQISEIISKKNSYLLLSLDSGTKNTYSKVKGKDEWDSVVSNIAKYKEEDGNVILKYIILPDNCTREDEIGFTEICVKNGIKVVQFSCDINADHNNLKKEIIDFAINVGRELKSHDIEVVVLPLFGPKNNEFIKNSI